MKKKTKGLDTETVRISVVAARRLREVAKRDDRTIRALIDAAVDALLAAYPRRGT